MTLSTSAVAVCWASASLDLPGARLHLVEQANVLDRDHGLVGKSSHHLHLARHERHRLGMHQPENALNFAVANEWSAEQCAIVANLRPGAVTVVGVGGHVGDMHRLPGHRHTSNEGILAGRSGIGVNVFPKFGSNPRTRREG